MERTSVLRFVLMLCVLSGAMLGTVWLMSVILAQAVVPTGWETFTSDLVVGVLTTGGLGVVLWFFTRKIDRDASQREARQVARLRWGVVVRRVGRIVNSEDFADDVLDASNLGPVARDLIELLRDEPMTEWHSALELEEIAKVTSVLSALETAVALGRKLNSEIRFAYGVGSRRSRQPVEAFQSVFVGEALGFNLDITARSFAINGKQRAKFMADVERIRSSNLTHLIAEYALVRASSKHLVDQLRSRFKTAAPSGVDSASPQAEESDCERSDASTVATLHAQS